MLTLALIVAMTSAALPDDISATIQAEKLRMNLLELREISRSERVREGGTFAILGTALTAGATFSLVNGLDRMATADSAGKDLVLGAYGVALISFGLVYVFTRPFEDESWNQLLDLSKSGPVDPAVFLAEGEALFEATVQRAVFRRRAAGASMILTALVYASLHLYSALSAPRIPNAPNPLEARHYLEAEVIDFALIALGIFYIAAVKTPTEQAWGAYMNDKNRQKPSMSILPLVSAHPNGVIAGLQGSF